MAGASQSTSVVSTRLSPMVPRSTDSSPTAITLAWLVTLRWGAVIGQTATILFSVVILNLGLPRIPLALLVLTTASTNIGISIGLRKRPNVSSSSVGWLLILDTLVLTALLYWSGGPSNPFSVLYLVHVTLAALTLGMRWAGGIVVLSCLSFAALFLWNVPISGMEHAHHEGTAFSIHLQGMWIAFAIAASLITYFVAQVARSLRAREAELAEAQLARARSEKLASLSTLSAGAAHELRTPLSTIAVVAKELERLIHTAPEEAAKDAQLIRAEVERCSAILQRMSAEAGQTMGEIPERVSASQILEEAHERLTPQERTRVQLILSNDGLFVCPREGLRQVLLSLLQNGLYASRDTQGAVRLSADAQGERVRFVVEDTGEGLAPELLLCVGEPFFTTKPPGEGLGLGLFLARAFAERWGGRFSFSAEPKLGAKVAIELPLEKAA